MQKNEGSEKKIKMHIAYLWAKMDPAGQSDTKLYQATPQYSWCTCVAEMNKWPSESAGLQLC